MSHDATAPHEHAHPKVGTYVLVGVILTIITAIEVAVFYLEAFRGVLAPTLLVLSAAKFALVVMFYMHLKQDNRLFTYIFLVPLIIAVAVLIALMFLFGQFKL